jgi:hypothetical protein
MLFSSLFSFGIPHVKEPDDFFVSSLPKFIIVFRILAIHARSPDCRKILIGNNQTFGYKNN